MDEIYDVIIIGSGPAGLTAGLYTARNNLRTLIIEKEVFGGKLPNRELIENYPGYPQGIMGPDLSSNMLDQVLNYKPEMQLGGVEKIEIDGDRKIVTTPFNTYSGKTVIIASGTHNRNLGVPGEQEYADKGVFYCATCDGPEFADKVVVVVGGGDAGLTEGLIMANIATKVIIIEMLPRCTATAVLQDRARANKKLEIKCGFKVEAITGEERVKSLNLLEVETGQKSTMPVDGILVYTGTTPNTDFLAGVVPLTDDAHVIVDESLETRVPGIFAAGDVRRNSLMQISTAVGDGAAVGISAGKFVTFHQ